VVLAIAGLPRLVVDKLRSFSPVATVLLLLRSGLLVVRRVVLLTVLAALRGVLALPRILSGYCPAPDVFMSS